MNTRDTSYSPFPAINPDYFFAARANAYQFQAATMMNETAATQPSGGSSALCMAQCTRETSQCLVRPGAEFSDCRDTAQQCYQQCKN